MEDAQNETKMLFSKLIDAFKLQGFKRDDAQDYLNWIKFFLKHYHQKPPSELDASDVKAFLKYLCDEKGLMPSRQKQAYLAINFFYNQVLKRSLWSNSHNQNKLDNLSLAQHSTTTDASNNVDKSESIDWIALLSEPFGLIAELRFQCGLKLEEVLNIRLEDIELDTQRLKIRDAFGNFSEIELSQTLLHSIKRQLESARHNLKLDKGGKIYFKSPTTFSRNQLTDNERWYFLFPGTLQLNIQTQKRVREPVEPGIVEQAFEEARTRNNQQKLQLSQINSEVKSAAV